MNGWWDPNAEKCVEKEAKCTCSDMNKPRYGVRGQKFRYSPYWNQAASKLYSCSITLKKKNKQKTNFGNFKVFQVFRRRKKGKIIDKDILYNI